MPIFLPPNCEDCGSGPGELHMEWCPFYGYEAAAENMSPAQKTVSDLQVFIDDISIPRDQHDAMSNAADLIEAMGNSLRTAVEHLEHMAAFIGKQKAGYSFEGLGEDIHGIRAAIETPK